LDLNGEKTWITSGTLADVAIVWARAEEGIRGFLVEKGTPGFTSSDIHGKWSMRASVTSSLSLAGLPGCRRARCCRARKV
jgi:glutaryl-CoA dehydrogenase